MPETKLRYEIIALISIPFLMPLILWAWYERRKIRRQHNNKHILEILDGGNS